jgi:hypothetical protein
VRADALGSPGEAPGAADDDLGKIDAAQDSRSVAGRQHLRLIGNPLVELNAARQGYEVAVLGRYFDPDQRRVEQRIARALCRLADARAAAARAQS